MEKQNEGESHQTEEVQTSPDVAPASETQTPPVEVEPTTEVGQTEVESETETGELNNLPQDQSEQAKAFQRLRQENKKLKDKLEERDKRTTGGQDIFKTLTSPDPNVQKTVRQIISEQKTEEKYPQLKEFNEDGSRNPDFDFDFAKQVQASYFHEFVEKGDANAMVAADKVAKYYFKAKEAEKIAQETTKKAKEQLTAKEQAALAATGRSQPNLGQQQEIERLKQRSRQGDDWAIAERLKRAGS